MKRGISILSTLVLVGAAYGCSSDESGGPPASYGGETGMGGGVTGGTAGFAQGGTAGLAQGGTAGLAQGGTAGLAQGGTAGTAQGGTAGTAQGGTAGTAQGGTAGTAQGGTAQGGSGGSATGGSGAAAGGGSEITNTEGEWIDGEVFGFPFVTGVSSYGDGTTTMELTASEGEVCLEGYNPGAGEDYELWGAGFSLQLAETDDDGNIVAAFDAAALGIVSVTVTITSSEGNEVRVQMSMVDRDGMEFESNGFPADEVDAGTYTYELTEFEVPSWAPEEMQDVLIDPTNLNSLQLQPITDDENPTTYQYCITELVWLDAEGNPVVPEPTGAGGAGGAGPVGTGGTATGGAATGGTAPGGAGPGGAASGGAAGTAAAD